MPSSCPPPNLIKFPRLMSVCGAVHVFELTKELFIKNVNNEVYRLCTEARTSLSTLLDQFAYDWRHLHRSSHQLVPAPQMSMGLAYVDWRKWSDCLRPRMSHYTKIVLPKAGGYGNVANTVAPTFMNSIRFLAFPPHLSLLQIAIITLNLYKQIQTPY